MDLKSYATDPDKKKEGIWTEFDGARFRIVSTDSPHYRRSVDRASKKRNPAKVRKDIETQTEIGIEAMAEGILVDWEGVKDGDKDVPCTRPNKIAVLTQVPALRDHIAAEAADLSNFAAEGVAADSEDFREGD